MCPVRYIRITNHQTRYLSNNGLKMTKIRVKKLINFANISVRSGKATVKMGSGPINPYKTVVKMSSGPLKFLKQLSKPARGPCIYGYGRLPKLGEKPVSDFHPIRPDR